jgi:hypothetical protein
MIDVNDNIDVLVSFGEENVYLNWASTFEPSTYVVVEDEGWSHSNAEEATDQEILQFLAERRDLDFLEDSSEDIYKIDDGAEV